MRAYARADQCEHRRVGAEVHAGGTEPMSWARIMAPLSGGAGDKAAVAAAVMLAEPFQAEMVAAYTPADVADVMPWMGEGFLGGVQTAALETLKEAAEAGEKNARAALES